MVSGLFLILIALLIIGTKNKLSSFELIPIPFFVLALSQYELISFAMASIQQYWQLLFAILSLVSLISFNGNRFLFASAFFAIAASFTGAGGLLSVSHCLSLFASIKEKWTAAVLWFFTAAVIFFIYFVDFTYQPTYISKASHKFALSHPMDLVEYVVAFIGNFCHNLREALIFGSLSIVTMAIIFALNFQKNDQTLTYIFAFIILTSFAAGLGRISLGVGKFLSSRYTIYGLLNAGILYVAIVSPLKQGITRRLLTLCGTAVSIFIYLSWLSPVLSQLSYKYNLQENIFGISFAKYCP